MQDLLDALPQSHLAWPLLVCAVPSAIPGLQLHWLSGPPIFYIAWSLWKGRSRLRLPAKVGRRRLSEAAAKRLLNWVLWMADRIERHSRPRWRWAADALDGRVAAGLVWAMAFLILIPFPGSNFLPSLSIIAIVPGLLHRDGAALVLAWLLGLASVALVAFLAWAGVYWAAKLW